MLRENNQLGPIGPMMYSNSGPIQTHVGLQETNLSLNIRLRKQLDRRDLVKMSTNLS
jgi:hypothetical protein